MKPVFKGKEVVVVDSQDASPNIGGLNEEKKATVKYIGKEQKVYQEGQTVLYSQKAPFKKLKYFGEDLIILSHEGMIICEIV